MPNPQTLKNLPHLLQYHFSKPILNNQSICIIGYGSGIFPQSITPTKNTIDLLMLVKNNHAFHQQMHRYKSEDYAGLPKLIGPSYLSLLNDYVFPTHFNHVQVQDIKIKYAVVDLLTFLYDLKTWRMLTFAGRMHKPVLFNILNQPQPKQLTQAIKLNHKMALNIGLLTLLGKTSITEPTPLNSLYQSISNISYTGDIRHTLLLQNTNKVNNIVKNNQQSFFLIYQPLLRELIAQLKDNSLEVLNQRSLKIRYTPQLITKLVSKQSLPEVLYSHFLEMTNTQNYKTVTETLLTQGAHTLRSQITTQLQKINRKSSIKMALQNFLGASLLNNFKYLLNKLKKKKL